MANRKTYTLQLRIFNNKNDKYSFLSEWQVFSNMKAAKQTRENLIEEISNKHPFEFYSNESFSPDVNIKEYHYLDKIYIFSITTFDLKSKPLKY